MSRPTVAEINLANLAHNFRILRKSAGPNAFFCPMVKADAYGHGDVQIARCLEHEGATHLGVALIEEGIRLRENGIKISILTFSFFEHDEVNSIIRHKLTPVITTERQLEILQNALPANARFPIHLKFNTGMNRLGFDAAVASDLATRLKENHRFAVQGVATHLLRSSDLNEPDGRSRLQMEQFERVKAHFPLCTSHILNSGGLLHEEHANEGARPGIAIYGVSSDFNLHTAIAQRLQPVMTLKTKVAGIRSVKKGETVSYGGIWTAPQDSVIGILPIGYADGYRRQLSNVAPALVRGKRVPVVGVVCMDYVMVDLSEIHAQGAVQPGEPVILFGQDDKAMIHVSELARLVGTIPYEILTGIGSRVPRVYSEYVMNRQARAAGNGAVRD